jgi:O-antigen ligase
MRQTPHPDGVVAHRRPDRAVVVTRVTMLATVALLPLIWWPSLHYVYTMPKTTVFRVGVGVILVCGFLALASGKVRVRLQVPDLLLLAFLAWMGMAALTSSWPLASLLGIQARHEGWLAFVGYGAFYAVARTARSSYLKNAAQAISLSAGLVGLLSVMEAWGLFHPTGQGQFGARVIATLGNPIFVGATLAVALPLAFGLLLLARTKSERVLYALLLALHAAGLYYALSRGPLLGTAVGAGVMAVLLAVSLRGTLRAKWRAYVIGSAAIGVAAVIVCLAIVIPLTPQVSSAGSDRVVEATRTDVGTGATRLVIWQATLRLIAQRPLLGWGEDTFLAEFPTVRPLRLMQLDSSGYPDRPHNAWLYLAYAGGLPALALYLLFLGAITLRSLRTLRDPRASWPRRVAIAALVGSIVAYEVQSLFSFSLVFVTPAAFVVLGALASLTSGAVRRQGGTRQGFGSRLSQREWTLGPRSTLAAGAILLLLALPLFTDAVRQTWADVDYVRATRAPWDAPALMAQAVALSPRDTNYARDWGRVWQDRAPDDTHALQNAITAFRFGIEHAPPEPDLPVFLAEVYQGQGRLAEAESTLRGLLARDAFHPNGLYNLSSLLLGQGRGGEAKPLLERLTSFSPADAEAWYALGQAREQTGDVTGARAAYQHTVQLAPGHTGATEALRRLGG